MKVHLVDIVANLRYVADSGAVQVPGFYVGDPAPETGVDLSWGTAGENPQIECSEAHFFMAKNGLFCTGKQSGYRFISPSGFLHFNDHLEQCYNRLVDLKIAKRGESGEFLSWQEVLSLVNQKFHEIRLRTSESGLRFSTGVFVAADGALIKEAQA